jgi:Uma2 family endonuclease
VSKSCPPKTAPAVWKRRSIDYLRFGVDNIWLIDPGSRLAWSYGREGQRFAARLLTTTNPDIELPIEDLFAELDAAVDFSDD